MPAPPGSGTIAFRRTATAAEREVGSEKTRLWIAYLAVVSIAFTQGTVGIFQTLASKPYTRALRPAADPRRSVPLSNSSQRRR